MGRTRSTRKPAVAATAATAKSPNSAIAETNGAPSQNGVATDVVDLADLFENETAVVALADPRDKYLDVKRDTGFRVEIGPLWSPEAHEVARESRAKLTLVDGHIDPEDPAVIDTIFEQVIAVTKRWWKEGESPDGITLRGEFLPCTRENVRKVYADQGFAWIYEAVKEVYLDRSRFFGQRPKTA